MHVWVILLWNRFFSLFINAFRPIRHTTNHSSNGGITIIFLFIGIHLSFNFGKKCCIFVILVLLTDISTLFSRKGLRRWCRCGLFFPDRHNSDITCRLFYLLFFDTGLPNCSPFCSDAFLFKSFSLGLLCSILFSLNPLGLNLFRRSSHSLPIGFLLALHTLSLGIIVLNTT